MVHKSIRKITGTLRTLAPFRGFLCRALEDKYRAVQIERMNSAISQKTDVFSQGKVSS